MNLYGMPILINDMQVRRPVKQVKRRMWHRRRCYADRVDKKWLKQFGTELVPLIRDGEVLSMLMPTADTPVQTFAGLQAAPRDVPSERRTLVMNSSTYRRLTRELPLHELPIPTGSSVRIPVAPNATIFGRHGARHG